MTIELVSEDLASRQLRQNLIGNDGIREIVGVSNTSNNLLSNIIGSVLDGLFNVAGWIVQGVFSALEFTFTAALDFLLSTVQTIWTLDWQQTDADIQQKVDALNSNSIGQLGQLLGQTAGWITCGLLPAGGIMTVNQLAGLYAGIQVGEEALDDLVDGIADTIKIIAKNEAQKMVYHTFKSTRKAIKKWNEEIPAESWERDALDYFLRNESEETIRQWGDPQNKPWSFSGSKDKALDRIQDKDIQQFWEEFWEEAGETCVEALYIVAQSLDNFVFQQKMIADEVNGEQVIVQIEPNREANETITLAGGANHVRSQMPLVLANYQMVENRDVGQWVGTPVAENVRNSPNELTLRIQLYSNKQPPIRDALQRASVSLPDVKRSALDFNKIKRAVGGSNGYIYGRFMGKARLDNGKSLIVYANTSQNAEERIQELAELIEPEILGITVTEEIRSGVRANGRPLQKQPIRIYPYSIYVENKQQILNQSTNAQGFPTLNGNYSRKSNRIEIWPNQKPDDFDQIIQELLRTPGI